jgi:hypothetical protein
MLHRALYLGSWLLQLQLPVINPYCTRITGNWLCPAGHLADMPLPLPRPPDKQAPPSGVGTSGRVVGCMSTLWTTPAYLASYHTACHQPILHSNPGWQLCHTLPAAATWLTRRRSRRRNSHTTAPPT